MLIGQFVEHPLRVSRLRGSSRWVNEGNAKGRSMEKGRRKIQNKIWWKECRFEYCVMLNDWKHQETSEFIGAARRRLGWRKVQKSKWIHRMRKALHWWQQTLTTLCATPFHVRLRTNPEPVRNRSTHATRRTLPKSGNRSDSFDPVRKCWRKFPYSDH